MKLVLNYPSKILLIVAFLLTSCQQEQNCDLDYYPTAPYGNADDTSYTDTTVRYVYVCYSGSYNKVVTYEMIGECWEMYVDEDYNINCK